jgi:hypothetical protein
MAEVSAGRSLRDRPLGRVLMLAAVLVLALLAARSCADTTPPVSADRAIEIARSVQDFEPGQVQVRFVRMGAPEPRGVWAVSMYQGDAARPTRVQLVTVDSVTGRILDDGRAQTGG